MATTKRSGLPSCWVTHLAQALVGESSCLLKPWLKANFNLEKGPSDFNTAAWKTDHTGLVQETVDHLTASGWTCKIESQNYFKLKGTTAEVAGKPDIVARKAAALKVVDCKTGAPQDAHGAQVAIYILCLPLAWSRPDLHLDGEVVYRTHTVPVHWESVQPMRTKFFALMRRMGAAERPAAVPSESECRFCEVTRVDCPERFHETPVEILTSEF